MDTKTYKIGEEIKENAIKDEHGLTKLAHIAVVLYQFEKDQCYLCLERNKKHRRDCDFGDALDALDSLRTEVPENIRLARLLNLAQLSSYDWDSLDDTAREEFIARADYILANLSKIDPDRRIKEGCARCGKVKDLAPDGTCWECAVEYRDEIINEMREDA